MRGRAHDRIPAPANTHTSDPPASRRPGRALGPAPAPEADAWPYFAVAAPGLEEVVARELGGLGIAARATPGGAAFGGGTRALYEANLRCRTASRVLLRVSEFSARAFYELEKKAGRVEWERFVARGRPVAFRVTSNASKLYHEGAIAQRLAEAVSRAGGTVAAASPGGDEEEAGEQAQLFVVRVLRDRFLISADASGTLLHRRGYRQAVAKAPLRETLAAAMLLAAGWEGASPLLDPFCGSGTILIEGALLARNIPPGLANERLEPRRYAFQRWGDYDPALWATLVERARAGVRPAAHARIIAGDRDAGAVAATRANAARAGVAGDVDAAVRPLSALDAPPGPGWLITNPPYGRRVGEVERLRDLYAALGHLARERLPGWTLALLSADRRLDGQIHLELNEALRTGNGGLPVRFMLAHLPPQTAATE